MSFDYRRDDGQMKKDQIRRAAAALDLITRLISMTVFKRAAIAADLTKFAVAVVIFLTCGLAHGAVTATAKHPTHLEEFRGDLQKLAAFPPDPCAPLEGGEPDWHLVNDIELRAFDQAESIVTESLNAPAADVKLEKEHATESLKQLEKISAELTSGWPKENRFHFQLLDLAPALIVKMTIHTNATFVVFGIPHDVTGQLNVAWQSHSSDITDESLGSTLDLFPLHRGPSGNARFLAKLILSGCAGPISVVYEADEWDPRAGQLQQIIKQEGTFGLDDKVPGFEQIGALRTEGSLITLPYCWFSGVDTWDNPSLCAVDTYDISGDDPKFRSRTYNRPDLLPVAKAIEYAEKRDYEAVLGYCASAQLARRLVSDFPPYVFAEDLRVSRIGAGRERVEMGWGAAYRFEVERRNGRWVVVGFTKK